MKKVMSVRMTAQRQVILEVLQAEKNHPTADDVYAKVRLRLTAHQPWDRLQKPGNAGRSGNHPEDRHRRRSQRRFDFTRESHHHVRCIECGALEDIPIEGLVLREEDLSGNSRRIQDHGSQDRAAWALSEMQSRGPTGPIDGEERFQQDRHRTGGAICHR